MSDEFNRHSYEHWAAYNDTQGDRPVYDLCRAAMAAAGPGNGLTAIDLGCGAGIETAALARDGWRVLALDGEPGVADRIARVREPSGLSAPVPAGGVVDVREMGFEDLDSLPPAELIHASYSLPYMPPAEFARVWRVIRAAARGVVAVNLFGERDSWADDPAMTFLSEAAARELFAGFEIVSWHEEDEPGEAFSGPKHWHVFDVVARLPNG